jgi:hypothetical protein
MSSFRDIVTKGSENLKSRLLIHAASLSLLAILFGVVILAVESYENVSRDSDNRIQQYLGLKGIDFSDPVDRALFRETLEAFYPGEAHRSDSLLQAIDELRQRQFTDPSLKSGNDVRGLSWSLTAKLLGMYLQFIGVYVVVLVIIYFLAQRLAIYRFVKMKQHRESYWVQTVELVRRIRADRDGMRKWIDIWPIVPLLIKAMSKAIGIAVLFSPAYVIAYSLKTTVDTSSLLFMILLGIVSNGVLIHTSNKFFTFLVTEGHKGYVQTAIVKNLHASYEWNVPDGISRRSLFRIRNGFQRHVFGHIFLNARFQFIPALKEHASFLITGLIIIEMALNIQGHLCYELLQQVLYRHFDIVCVIIFGIFLAVKCTEAGVDIWHDYEKRKHGY